MTIVPEGKHASDDIMFTFESEDLDFISLAHAIEGTLIKLGELEPRDIANEMRQQQITANIGLATSCAISEYMRKEHVLTEVKIATTYSCVDLTTEESWACIRIPHRVSVFIHNFDVGIYPDIARRKSTNIMSVGYGTMQATSGHYVKNVIVDDIVKNEQSLMDYIQKRYGTAFGDQFKFTR